MMEARVRDDSRLPAVQAHTGRWYVKGEWRSVPDGDEAAMIPEYLEYRDVGDTAVSDEPVAEPEPKPAAKSSRSKAKK